MAENSWGEFLSAPAWGETALVIAALLFNLACQIFAIYKATCRTKTAEVTPSSPVKIEKLAASNTFKQNEISVEDLTDAPRQFEASREGLLDIKLDNVREKKPKKIRLKQNNRSVAPDDTDYRTGSIIPDEIEL